MIGLRRRQRATGPPSLDAAHPLLVGAVALAALALSVLCTLGLRLPPIVVVFIWLPAMAALYWANYRAIAWVRTKNLNRVPTRRLTLSTLLAAAGALATALWILGTLPDQDLIARQLGSLEDRRQQIEGRPVTPVPDLAPAQRKVDETDRDLHEIQRQIICEADGSCGTGKEGEGPEFQRKKQREQELKAELAQRQNDLNGLTTQATKARQDAAQKQQDMAELDEQLRPLRPIMNATPFDRRAELFRSTMRGAYDRPDTAVAVTVLALLLLLCLDLLPLRHLCRRAGKITLPMSSPDWRGVDKEVQQRKKSDESKQKNPPITAQEYDERQTRTAAEPRE